MDIIKRFNSIRDIPYRLSLVWEEENLSCIGKHERFMKAASAEGYSVRHRLCSFRWSECGLPEEIISIPHKDESVHSFCEICIDGKWIVVDLTWDWGLRDVLPVNEWDGKSDCRVAVNASLVFCPEKSEEIVHSRTKEKFIASRQANKEFFSALNAWLEEERKK